MLFITWHIDDDWNSVRRGEKRWIFAYQEHGDLMNPFLCENNSFHCLVIRDMRLKPNVASDSLILRKFVEGILDFLHAHDPANTPQNKGSAIGFVVGFDQLRDPCYTMNCRDFWTRSLNQYVTGLVGAPFVMV